MEYIDKETWNARAWYYDGLPHKYIICTVDKGQVKAPACSDSSDKNKVKK